MTVWVVYTEAQNGDPSIDGLFSSRKAARECWAAQIRELQEMGNRVYGQAEKGLRRQEREEAREDSNWQYDVHCEAHELQEAEGDRLARIAARVAAHAAADRHCTCNDCLTLAGAD